jgi:hypothetical protein
MALRTSHQHPEKQSQGSTGVMQRNGSKAEFMRRLLESVVATWVKSDNSDEKLGDCNGFHFVGTQHVQTNYHSISFAFIKNFD